ncbi:MAG: HD domain-containing protein [Clostridiales bacterium]|nr:HD domain-containing protein [Clostridiales bacterium]
MSKEMALIVLYHHERWDGKGYLAGTEGELISLGSRIIAICDTVDAMTSTRIYLSYIPA